MYDKHAGSPEPVGVDALGGISRLPQGNWIWGRKTMGNKKAIKRMTARRAATLLAALGALVMSSGIALMATATPANAAAAEKVTFCHSTGSNSNPWVEETTSMNAFYVGHVLADHTSDIYPAVSFVKKGVTVNVDAQGDQAVLANHCQPVETPPEVCPDGTDHAGEPIPEGGIEACDDPTPPATCPDDATANAGQEIPEGQTEETFCNAQVSPPETCPAGTDNAGQEIPAGQSADAFCNDEVIVSPPKKHHTTTTVTPTVVHAGLAGATVQDMRGEQGLALTFVGMMMLAAAGGLTLRLRGSAARI
jgi:hypothetical protein